MDILGEYPDIIIGCTGRGSNLGGLIAPYMQDKLMQKTKIFEAIVLFAKTETILPAPKSAHAIKGAIDEALKCKEKTITLFLVFLYYILLMLIMLY